MKSLYVVILLMILFVFKGVGQNPKTSKEIMKDLTGIWHLDSTQTDGKTMPDFLQQQLDIQSYYAFYPNNIMVQCQDKRLFLRDSFSIGELNHKAVIINRINYIQIRNIDRNHLVVEVNEPGSTRMRRQATVNYFTKVHSKDLFPKLSGSWSGRSSTGYARFNEQNSNWIRFEGGNKISLRIHNVTDSGTWSADPENFALKLSLASGQYTSWIMSKEMNLLEITNPYNSGEYLDFALEKNQPASGMNPGQGIQISEQEPEIPMEIHFEADTKSLLQNWKAVRIINGRDTLPVNKPFNITLETNGHYHMVYGSRLTKDSFEIRKNLNIIVLHSGSKNIMCGYFFPADIVLSYPPNADKKKKTLLLSLRLPGEEKEVTYLLKSH